MKRDYTPLVFGIIALVIVFIEFLAIFYIKSLEPEDNTWYWNTPLIIYFIFYPAYLPFAVIGAVRSAKRLRIKEERSFTLASLIVNASAVFLGAALLLIVIFAYQYWPRLW